MKIENEYDFAKVTGKQDNDYIIRIGSKTFLSEHEDILERDFKFNGVWMIPIEEPDGKILKLFTTTDDRHGDAWIKIIKEDKAEVFDIWLYQMSDNGSPFFRYMFIVLFENPEGEVEVSIAERGLLRKQPEKTFHFSL